MTQVPLVQIHGIDEVRIDQVDHPQAGADDVIIKVSHCGICGSDISFVAMGGLMGPDTPMPLGHELSGTVVEAGVNVQHVSVGDRVVVNPEGNDNRIGCCGPQGGFTSYLLVSGAALDEQSVIKLPDNVSFEQGALVEPLSVAMHAVHQGKVTEKDRVVIFGAGPIGLCILMVLRYYGVKEIVVIDLAEPRLAIARDMGATVINANTDDLAAALIAEHGSAEVMTMPVPACDVYFEATGVGAVFNQAVSLGKMGARIVVVGVHKVPIEIDLVNLLIRELNITGSMAYPNEFPQVIDMLSSGKVDTSVLISHRYSLNEFPSALAMAQDTQKAVKVLIDCQSY